MSTLPADKKNKKINKTTFVNLAKKVRKILEKEAEYARKEGRKNGANYNSRIDLLTARFDSRFLFCRHWIFNTTRFHTRKLYSFLSSSPNLIWYSTTL